MIFTIPIAFFPRRLPSQKKFEKVDVTAQEEGLKELFRGEFGKYLINLVFMQFLLNSHWACHPFRNVTQLTIVKMFQNYSMYINRNQLFYLGTIFFNWLILFLLNCLGNTFSAIDAVLLFWILFVLLKNRLLRFSLRLWL